MGKTFYEVRYNDLGYVCPRTRWFSDRKEAYEFFYGCRAADRPRAHHFRSLKKIADYQLRVEQEL